MGVWNPLSTTRIRAAPYHVDDNDIEYNYTSRLPGEPLAGVDDVHLHPAEPCTLPISLTRRF